MSDLELAGDEQHKISEIFGENIFSLNNLKEYVTESSYEKIKGVILKQEQMDFSTAENVAEGLIKWAMSKGVTHYTHWFHPLTGSTAEKHDAFFKPSIDLEARASKNFQLRNSSSRNRMGPVFHPAGFGPHIWREATPSGIHLRLLSLWKQRMARRSTFRPSLFPTRGNRWTTRRLCLRPTML